MIYEDLKTEAERDEYVDTQIIALELSLGAPILRRVRQLRPAAELGTPMETPVSYLGAAALRGPDEDRARGAA